MKLIKHKLKGNSIVEVLIALAILSFCSSLAMIIYSNLQKSSLPFFKVKAVELAEFYMKDALDKKTFTEETFKAEEFTVKKLIKPNELYGDCYIIRILVFDVTKKKIHELETSVFSGK
jgi:hypothetical protein